MRTFACIAAIASLAVTLPLALTAPARAQDLYLPSGSYTANDTTYQTGNIFVGMDSGNNKTNGVGDPYVATLDIVDGGWVKNTSIYNASTFNISGGISVILDAYDSSTVNVTGGETQFLASSNNSTINISGGSPVIPGNVNSFIEVDSSDTSTVNISGGNGDRVFAFNNSTVNVSGGQMEWILGMDSSTVNIRGGQVKQLNGVGSSILNLTGGLVGVDFPTSVTTGPGYISLSDQHPQHLRNRTDSLGWHTRKRWKQ